jgi:enoyl-CoA hydratase/carnithine racemase
MSVDDEQLVLSDRRGAVLVLTLNRPEKLNAWSDALEAQYYALLDEAEDDPDVRAIVVTGAGRGFCSGADLEDLQGAATGKIDTENARRSRSRAFPLTIRKPMIAAINGAAVGLGLVEALYCDVRFAAPNVKLSTVFARRGLVAEYGLAWILARLVGPSTAFDLLASGRTVLGEEAHRLRLVDRLAPAEQILDDAVAYANELATFSSPWSMATMKAQISADLERGFAESFEASEQLMVESFRRGDVEEGVRSFMERRPPEFAVLEARSRQP